MSLGTKKEPTSPPDLNHDQQLIMKELVFISSKLDCTWFYFCGRPISLDGAIGLLPMIGDFATTVVSLYIVWRCYCAFDNRIRKKWWIMLMNVLVDFMLGSIPLIGDYFDVFWKWYVSHITC